MMYMYDTDGDMDYKWEHHFGPLTMIPDWPADPPNGVPGYKGWRLNRKPFRYVNDQDRDLLADERCADWSAEVIGRKHDKPFAIFTGFVRAHTPLYAPQEYFDRFPLDSIELPETIANDLDDCATPLADRTLYGFRRYDMLFKHDDPQLYRKWLQAYMACVSFVDDQVGKVLDAVDKRPDRDNTIVIFTSDHGFHVGEKEFLYKQSLWDGATRIPFIIAGVKGQKQGATCHHPVSLVDIYPTINELCRVSAEPNVDAKNPRSNNMPLQGHSLRGFLQRPDSESAWTGPDFAITALPGKDHSQHKLHRGTWFPHFSVRSRHHRYTLCSNGEEELYDYQSDPREWKNLAADPAYADIKAELRKRLEHTRDDGTGERFANFKLQHSEGATVNVVGGEAPFSRPDMTFSGDSQFYLSSGSVSPNFRLQFELKSDNSDKFRIQYRVPEDAKWRRRTPRIAAAGRIESGRP